MIHRTATSKEALLIPTTRHLLLSSMLALAACSQARAAPDAESLARLVNAYRETPGLCQGRPKPAAPPLQVEPALSRVHVVTGTFLEQALEDRGYPVERAQSITVSGPEDLTAAFAVMEERYCPVLLDSRFTAIGALHTGNEWQVVLARPQPPARLGSQRDTGQAILDAVNAARAAGRSCGERSFGPAAPVVWNAELAQAALAHSDDMARHHYFNHRGSDGSFVGDRTHQAGYNWRRVGENIASGVRSPEDAMAGWLDSPGHCANLMDPAFTEMGAAYATNPNSKSGTAYWTQVFGRR
ncbi:MAG: CAP domain-containing protein [Telluria sp.]